MAAKNSVGIAFAHHYISRLSPTLIVHFNFSSSLSIRAFCRSNQYKNKFLPRQNKNKTAIAIFGLTKGLSPKCIT